MSRILVCGVQTPYVSGGAEILVETLAQQLRTRGHQVDVIALPYTDAPRTQVVLGFMAWRILNLQLIHEKPVDLVIGTKFPSYAVNHRNKVVWLTHQHRQAYELYGTKYSDMHTRPDGMLFARIVRGLDGWSLGEAKALFSISQNTANRLKRYNGLDARPLYPPPRLAPLLHCERYDDYLLAIGRFEPIKRFDLILRALALTKCGVRCVLVGDGMQRAELEQLTDQLGVRDRVQFAGNVDDATLADLYANCLGVVYPPFDEDYGYVTVEALLSKKPVISTTDSGGVLEFLREGEDGFIAEPTPESLAEAIERLWSARSRVADLGEAGYQRVKGITWEPVIDGLTSTL